MATQKQQQQNPVQIVEVCKIKPNPTTPESKLTGLNLPLTFYDTLWLRFPPVERLYFYKLTGSDSSPDRFNSVILPKLKHSLSLSLHQYFPLSGSLTWPPHAPCPTIVFDPETDSSSSVSLTVAVSSADFLRLSGNGLHDSSQSLGCVPPLHVSDDVASLFSAQITLFPHSGFCIGYCNHHCVLDGRGTTSFMKAWAFYCKNLVNGCLEKPEASSVSSGLVLPHHLRPVFDRSCVEDVKGFGNKLLNLWQEIMEKIYPESFNNNPKNLKLLPQTIPTSSVRATFELTRADLNKIKNMVLSGFSDDEEQKRRLVLSTFVLTCAYTFVGMVKARSVYGGEENREVYFVFAVDYRNRVEPVVPVNYFGNCIFTHNFVVKASECVKENGVSIIAERISRVVKGLETGENLFQGIDDLFSIMKSFSEGIQLISVAGSNRFGVYETDFGWGKPEKVEIASIGRTGAIALADSRNGGGGVEVGLALPASEMEAFTSFFVDGLKYA